MSLSDIRRQLFADAEKTMGRDYIEFARNDNSKKVRDKLIAMNHYFHILYLLGDTELNEAQMFVYFDLARDKIAGIRDRELQQKELVKINLLSMHTSAWNVAHFHYEKAVKTLCMMMVTLMDYIIQEQGGASVLYPESDTIDYSVLADEIASLCEQYREDYFAICAFDYCTQRMGKYLDVPQYEGVSHEHDRLIRNGNPKRVTDVMNRLRQTAGQKRQKEMDGIERAYTPEPVYAEDVFAECYQKTLEQYGSETEAMADLPGLISGVRTLYRERQEECS